MTNLADVGANVRAILLLTTVLADRIVVLKDGEIAEDGSHEELLSANGEYARLYLAQTEWYNR